MVAKLTQCKISRRHRRFHGVLAYADTAYMIVAITEATLKHASFASGYSSSRGEVGVGVSGSGSALTSWVLGSRKAQTLTLMIVDIFGISSVLCANLL